MSNDLILHQYAMSPFAEKARLMLGFKGLAWDAVEVPAILPKPDVVALTGGYRRTPFLQIGADVYCDTALIARVLEARAPAPPLFPAVQPLAAAFAQWADGTLFWLAVVQAMQAGGAAVLLGQFSADERQAFAADRAAFTAGLRRPTPADAAAQLRQHLDALEAQLAARGGDGPGLLGRERSVADFAVAHCLWFIRRGGAPAAILAGRPRLAAWLDATLAIGHGPRRDIDSAEAIARARAAGGHAPVAVATGQGLAAGEPVTVSATDYGADPVAGTLVGLDDVSVTLRRDDERAGALQVHFPRQGFQIRKENKA